jgi:arginine-tRNA-protein transferase
VTPLRIRLNRFGLSKSQRRVAKRNADLKTLTRPVEFDDEKHEMFDRHAERFDHGKPENLYSFLDENAANIPGETVEFCVYHKGRLAAVSFLDIGETSVSSIYAMFEPEFSKRSLGIFTMLLEIDYAIATGKTFYYQGYAYQGVSFYDYKKNFKATEVYDWKGRWTPKNET